MKLLLPLLLLFCSACSSIEASSDFDPDTDFSSFETFVMGAPPEKAPRSLPNYSELAGKRINRRIAEDLIAKGLREVPESEADLLVTFQLAGEPRSEVRSSGARSSVHYSRHNRWYGVGWYDNDAYTVHYVVGTLIIDVFDRAQEKLVWHGWSSTGLYESSDEEEKGKEVLEALLERYPPN